MGTAPRQAYPPSVVVNLKPSPIPVDQQKYTVEESCEEHDLIGVLRRAASGGQPLEPVLEALADAARVLSGADGTALALTTKDSVVCRARSGEIAPELGAPMNTESGISGECLRRATMLVCHDAFTDARVDKEVCRSLGIRSVVVVPLRGSAGVAGILEAFSTRPNAFDGGALNSLRELAEIAQTAYQREGQETGMVIKPLARAVSPATYATPPLAAEDILENSSEPSTRRLLIVTGIVIALLLTVAVAWWSWQVPADEAGGMQSVRAASSEQPRSMPARVVVAKPTPGMLTRRSDRSRPEIVLNAAEVQPIEVKPEAPPSRLSEYPAAHSKLGAGTDAPAPEPPPVSLAPSPNSEELTRLTSVPTLLPSAPPRISEGVTEPALIRKIAPTYPMQARSERLSGKVVLSATIDADGSIRDVAVVSGSPILADSAAKAVRQWRYSPAMLNGTPVAIQKQITFLFTLP